MGIEIIVLLIIIQWEVKKIRRKRQKELAELIAQHQRRTQDTWDDAGREVSQVLSQLSKRRA